MDRPDTIGSSFVGVVIAVVLGRFVLFSSRPLSKIFLAVRRAGRAEGVVVQQSLSDHYMDTTTGYRWTIDVKYRADGEERTFSFLPSTAWTNMGWLLDRTKRRFAVGNQVSVRYDPRNPENVLVAKLLVRPSDVAYALLDLALTTLLIWNIFTMAWSASTLVR